MKFVKTNYTKLILPQRLEIGVTTTSKKSFPRKGLTNLLGHDLPTGITEFTKLKLIDKTYRGWIVKYKNTTFDISSYHLRGKS